MNDSKERIEGQGGEKTNWKASALAYGLTLGSVMFGWMGWNLIGKSKFEDTFCLHDDFTQYKECVMANAKYKKPMTGVEYMELLDLAKDIADFQMPFIRERCLQNNFELYENYEKCVVGEHEDVIREMVSITDADGHKMNYKEARELLSKTI